VYKFLQNVPVADLPKLLVHELVFFSKLPPEHLDRDKLYKVLFSWYGYDILYEPNVRKLLLLSLSSDVLLALAKEFKINKNLNTYDTALKISSLPWRVNSLLVWRLAALFDIPLDFLPVSSRRPESIETIEPYVAPPELFSYQEDVIQQVGEFLYKSSTKSSLIQLPTGSGKTRTVIEALVQFCNIHRSNEGPCGILWLAHTEELCDQAYEAFRRIWQAKGESDRIFARFWGNHNINIQEILGGTIVCGYQKIFNLYKKDLKKFKELINDSRIMVIDEAHKSLAPSLQKIIKEIKSLDNFKLIGLTATPGRFSENDKENKALANLFDKNLITPTGFGDNAFNHLQKLGVISKIKHYSFSSGIKVQLTDQENEFFHSEFELRQTVLSKLASNEERNNLIIDLVAKEIENKNPTLVFSCTVDHSKQLAAKLAMRGHKTAAIDYRMRRTLRQQIIREFRKGEISVLFNFGVLSTGFDAPNIKSIIIARPTASIVLYSQMIGRGLRGSLVGGSEECNLIDIKDNFGNFGAVEDVYNYFGEYWN
jgi:DNA repair protein RadD